MRYKERFGEYEVSVATVSGELLEEYKRLTGCKETGVGIIKNVIEEKILFRKIENKEDIAELKEIAKSQYYNLPGEMISYLIRDEIKDKMELCRNCPYLQDNIYCPVLNVKVNPYQKSCGTV